MDINYIDILKNDSTSLIDKNHVYNALAQDLKQIVKTSIIEVLDNEEFTSSISNSQWNMLKKHDRNFTKNNKYNKFPNINVFIILLKLKPENFIRDTIINNVLEAFLDEENRTKFLNNELDDLTIIDLLLKNEEVTQSQKTGFCQLFHINCGSIFSTIMSKEDKIKSLCENVVKKEDYDKEITKYVNQNKEDRENIKQLKEQIAKFKNDISQHDSKENELESTIESKNGDIKKLNEKCAVLEQDKQDLTNQVKTLSDENKALKDKPIKVVETKPAVSDNQYNSENNLISADQIRDDIDGVRRIGYVDPKFIKKVNNSWTITITSFNEIVPDTSYLDKAYFDALNDCRYANNNKPTYLQFIYKDIYEDFADEAYANFEFSNEQEQRNKLIDIFCNKIIEFEIIASWTDTDEPRLRAEVTRIMEYYDFNESTYVPIIKSLTIERFKEAVKNGSEIYIDKIGATLFNKINYIVIGQSLFKVNLLPQKIDGKFKLNSWVSIDNKVLKIGKIEVNKYNENHYHIPENNLLVVNNVYLTKTESDSSLSEKKANEINTISETDFINKIYNYSKKKHLCYDINDIKNFHVAIKTSNLVILAGPSGLGKSRLPEIYANALNINEAKRTLLFVSVNPSYTEPSDLLGYVKPLIYKQNELENPSEIKAKDTEKKTEEVEEKGDFDGVYEESSTQLVSFLKSASNNTDKLHIVIFDEMNLSQIEYWFAPFMSVLERDNEQRNIQLYADKMNIQNKDIYPSNINIGDNVIFIGTINLDETTKDMSDRLLDRSVVINLHKQSFKDYYNDKLDETDEGSTLNIPSSLFATFKNNKADFIKEFTENELDFLDGLHEIISSVTPQKGVSFRNVKMISNFVANSKNIFTRDVAFDLAIKQTILRKINGNEREIERLLSKENDKSLYNFFERYKDISDFKETIRTLDEKRNELDIYGFTR